jgi:hypothetical protein
MVPERKAIAFKAGKYMEDRLNGRVPARETGDLTGDV